MPSTNSRRDFLKVAALGASGMMVPYHFSSAQRKPQSANDKLNVAAIGVGGRGSGIGRQAAQRGNMVACCDVDQKHAEKFAAGFGGKCRIYHDYRKLLEWKDIDLVTIGTPDHWHTAICIAALQAGKDVYCEKPLTLTIDEGRLLCRVVRETGRVFQVGTQQRSEYRSMFLKAVVLARSGRLGKKLRATCSIGGGPKRGPFPTTDPPPHLDWDFWLGQTPQVPYSPERCHGTFRWWLEYSGGKLTDWGAHHIDIAQWALGLESSGVVEVEGEGNFPVNPDRLVQMLEGKISPAELPNQFNTATEFHIDLALPNGNQIHVQHGPGNGILIEGEKGRIFVSRGRLTGKPIEELSEADKQWLDREVVKLYKGKQPGSHMGNFFECIRDRTDPISDVYSHHRAMTLCHLCNIAMLLRRKLRYDLETEDFLGDEQASSLRSRRQRAPYTIEV